MTKNSINNNSSDLQVSAINIAGSTISTTTSNTNLSLTPNGTGKVSISGAYTLPNTDGTNGQLLFTDGAGNLSFGIYSSVNIQTFTSSGVYTPTTGLVQAIIEVVGGGGGGGGCSAAGASTINNGGGGGGGGYSSGIFTPIAVGVSQVVTIGNGGSAGSSTVPGGNGGTTSVGSLISATGGQGGLNGPTASTNVNTIGGVSGIGIGGNINITGTDGKSGTGYDVSLEITGGTSVGGWGGSSYYAPELTNIGTASTGKDGLAGNLYGGGATGAFNYNNGTVRVGGAGGKGIVIITEYIS